MGAAIKKDQPYSSKPKKIYVNMSGYNQQNSADPAGYFKGLN